MSLQPRMFGSLSVQFFHFLTCISTACSRTLVPPFSLGPMADMAIMIHCEISTIPDPIAHNVGTASTHSRFLAIGRPLWPGPLDRLLRPFKGYNVPAPSSKMNLPHPFWSGNIYWLILLCDVPPLHQGQFLRIRNWEYCFPTSFDHQIDLQFLPLWSVYQLPYVSAQSCDISSVSWPFLTPLASQHDPVMRRLCQQATDAKPTSMIDQWIPTHFHNQKKTSVPLLRSRPQVYQTLQHHSFSATLDLWTVRLCVIVTFAYFPSCSVMFQACDLSIKLSTLNSLLHPQFIKKATFCHDSTASHRETKTQRRASTANLRMSATSPASKPTHSEISASKNRPGVHTWLGPLSFQIFNLLTCISTACSRTLVPPFSLGPMADMAIMIDCEISTIPDPVAHNVGTAPTSSQFLAIDRPLWPGPLDRLLRPLKGYNVPAWFSILKLPPSILNRQYLLTHIIMWGPTLHQGQFLRIRNWEYCFPTSFDRQIDFQFLPRRTHLNAPPMNTHPLPQPKNNIGPTPAVRPSGVPNAAAP